MADNTQNPKTEDTATVSIGYVKWLYSEISSYDTHYSSVRSGVSVFLIGVMFLMTREILSKDLFLSLNFVIFLSLILILNLFTILVNFYFQRMTTSCKVFQKRIESIISEYENIHESSSISIPKKYLLIREEIGNIFKIKNSYAQAFSSDMPFKLVIIGSLIFWISLFSGVFLTNFNIIYKAELSECFSKRENRIGKINIECQRYGEEIKIISTDISEIKKSIEEIKNNDQIVDENDVISVMKTTWPLKYIMWD